GNASVGLQCNLLHSAFGIYLVLGPTVGAIWQLRRKAMTQYLIEREIAGAGDMSEQALRDASKHSNTVLAEMSPEIQWVHSYVAGDKIYCVYNAPNEQLIREHAEKSGFPANKITPVSAVIDPSTANG